MTPKLAVPAGVLVAACMLPAGTSAATSTCPDGMTPTLVIVNPEYAKRDRNGNFIVCVKDANAGAKGGPDDKSRNVADDIIV